MTKVNANKLTKVAAAVGLTVATAFSLVGCVPGSDGLSGELDSSFIAIIGDYGDAPEKFPTKGSSNGAHHLDTTKSALGYSNPDGSLSVSAEVDAIDPNDPDGAMNLVDQDLYDDGFLIGLLPPGGLYDLPVVVSVAADAEEKARYINILADWNQDLEWNGSDDNGAPEWVVENYEVHVAPGTTERIFLPTAKIGHQMYEVWFRVTLSETQVAAGPAGWDGTGEFQEGETEDYIFHTLPQNEIIIDDPANPPPPPLPPDDGDGDDGAGDDDGAGNGGNNGGAPDPDDPDGDGQPGVDPNNAGKLRRRAANAYSLVLCKGKTWRRGFEWETQVRNGSTSNPFTATVGWTTDPGSVIIHAVDVGTSQIGFEANTVSFPVETVEWVTGLINVTVIDCDPVTGEPVDGGGVDGGGVDEGGPWDGIDNAGPEDAGKLVHASGNEYYLVLCHCAGPYSRGFQYETFVYNGTSSDGSVASVSLSNDPGTITITPTGFGETTIEFDADPSTFPYNDNELTHVIIHVKVIDCLEY